jgi:hypothetical protein
LATTDAAINVPGKKNANTVPRIGTSEKIIASDATPIDKNADEFFCCVRMILKRRSSSAERFGVNARARSARRVQRVRPA